jgi:hypothetical protein
MASNLLVSEHAAGAARECRHRRSWNPVRRGSMNHGIVGYGEVHRIREWCGRPAVAF